MTEARLEALETLTTQNSLELQGIFAALRKITEMLETFAQGMAQLPKTLFVPHSYWETL